MDDDDKPKDDGGKIADQVSSDDPKITQKLTQAGDDFDPNEG